MANFFHDLSSASHFFTILQYTSQAIRVIARPVAGISLHPIQGHCFHRFMPHRRSKTDKEHHNGTSIIEKIPRTKTSLQSQCKISLSLINLSTSMPREFMRKPRSLDILKRWKATEFLQFLLYTGPVVLLKNITDDRYSNFLALHAAFVILSHRKYFSQLDYAVELLQYFVESFEFLYGRKHVSHNVHNLLHLVDDVKNHAPLDNFSSFPFETFLQSIKKCIRKSEKPFQQIVKRQLEKSHFSIEAVHSPSV